jgi:hypothetical protein
LPLSGGAKPYIEYVFENELIELDAAGTLAAAEANEHAMITAEVRQLQIAAHWADLHPGDAVTASRLPGTEHPIRLGGDGTPTVGGFAAAELGCALRMSDGSAARMIGDALDLRHRLPLIWAAVQAGQVPAYQARVIAKATRHLTIEQAGWVDQKLAPALGALPWGRVQTLLDAAIIEADPDGAEQQAADAVRERFVRLGRKSEHGLKLIIARATAGDAIWFKATIDRIAEILGKQGDTDPVEVRRSKAIGVLAQPALALQLLCQHQDDDWDGPAEPSDDAEEPPEDEFGFDDAQSDADHTAAQADADLTAAQATPDPLPDPQVGGEHQSLQILPPPFGPQRARPRAVIYVHLSAEALTAGAGIARVENVGPILLSRLRLLLGEHCTINLKPVIDLPAGHTPIDAYEIPASLREQLQLRYPRCVPVRRRRQPIHRCGPHDSIPEPRPRRAARPNPARQPRTPHPPPPQPEDARTLAGPTTRTRHLALAITPRQDLSGQHHRHPPPRQHRIRPSHLACRRGPTGKLAS